MKSEEQIQNTINDGKDHISDSNWTMDQLEWANASGWIEALEWVLGNIKVGENYISEEELDESSK